MYIPTLLSSSKKSISANETNNYNIDFDNLLQQLKRKKHKMSCKTIQKLVKKIKCDSNPYKTFPIELRYAIYYVAYKYCGEDKDKSISNRLSIQKKTLEECGLSLNLFTKWKLNPKKDYKFFNDNFKLKLYRAGRKTSDLLALIKYLISTQNSEVFVDVFGGTGSVTAAVSEYFDKCILNEFDSDLCNLLEQIKDNPNDVLECCKNIYLDIKGNKYNIKEATAEYIESQRINKYYDEAHKIKGSLCDILIFYEMLHKNYSTNSDYHKLDASLKAAILYFLMSFKVNVGATDFGTSGVNIKSYIDFLDKLSINNKHEVLENYWNEYWFKSLVSHPEVKFIDMKKSEIFRFNLRLQKADIFSMDFQQFYNKISSEKSGVKKIWYFDPPYFMTSQYRNSFSDAQHVELIRILKRISDSGDKWVFSCKDKITNNSQSKTISKYRKGSDGKGAIIQSFKDYFKGFLADKEFIITQDKYECVNAPKVTNNHKLYVYKLKKEQHHEIVITNFEHLVSVPIYLADKVSLKGVPQFTRQEFEEFLESL